MSSLVKLVFRVSGLLHDFSFCGAFVKAIDDLLLFMMQRST
jgi:hypothetical protein